MKYTADKENGFQASIITDGKHYSSKHWKQNVFLYKTKKNDYLGHIVSHPPAAVAPPHGGEDNSDDGEHHHHVPPPPPPPPHVPKAPPKPPTPEDDSGDEEYSDGFVHSKLISIMNFRYMNIYCCEMHSIPFQCVSIFYRSVQIHYFASVNLTFYFSSFSELIQTLNGGKF